jgi:hypothetical protein
VLYHVPPDKVRREVRVAADVARDYLQETCGLAIDLRWFLQVTEFDGRLQECREQYQPALGEPIDLIGKAHFEPTSSTVWLWAEQHPVSAARAVAHGAGHLAQHPDSDAYAEGVAGVLVSRLERAQKGE